VVERGYPAVGRGRSRVAERLSACGRIDAAEFETLMLKDNDFDVLADGEVVGRR
jgi:hypothetical protein